MKTACETSGWECEVQVTCEGHMQMPGSADMEARPHIRQAARLAVWEICPRRCCIDILLHALPPPVNIVLTPNWSFTQQP